MYSKCDCHLLETLCAFSKISEVLGSLNNIDTKFNFFVKDYISVTPIEPNSTVGEQIRHYRQLKGIQQKDIAKIIGIDRYTMHQIENYEYKQIENPAYIKEIIEYLDIKDKIIWNDKYLEFIYLNKQSEIKEFRAKYNISITDFSNMLEITKNTLKNWEANKSVISRKSFIKYQEVKFSFEKNKKINNETYEYYLFLKNNNLEKIIKKYIEKEEITLKEFARRMDRHPHTIERILHNKSILTLKQYNKLKELLDNQEKGFKSSDPYIEFINSDYNIFIKKVLKEFNMSRAELARQLEIGRTTTERWIRKEIVISRKNYLKLIKFINKKRKTQTIN